MRLKKLLGGFALALAAATGPARRRTLKIGFITKFPVPFFATMEDAAKAYAAAPGGGDRLWPGPVGDRYRRADRADRVDGAQGVHGIALTPVDPTVASALDNAIENGVKVVLMDNSIPDWDGRTALATTDNYAAGMIAGEYLATLLRRRHARHP